ncbi:MAG: DNA polymerase I [Cytophagaceae bacterium]|nr:DNA polymerase I [Cytophagaceae bacterium]MDW8456996.1 DNA polymerase I [Cytophagaceae bacterium]
MSEKKLFLLDAYALIFRAHFAFSKNPRVTSKGLNTSAVFGFTNSLFEAINKQKPTHIGVAFDGPEITFREEKYENYKANRQETPEDIVIAVPYIKKVLNCLKIPILEIPGYEADDIAGTLAKKAEKKGYKVFLMTMDKDYCQLVSENIFLYKPAYIGNGYDIYDIPKVLEKFSIQRIEQVTDILGLMGDSVDNIPGIPGVGEKTAQKLIAEFGSIENLLKNTDKLKGKLKENVVKYAQQGLLSKELATIHCDVPIDFDEELFRHKEPDREKLSALFDELEFRTLKKRILGEDDEEKKQTPKPTEISSAKNKTTDAIQISLFDESAKKTDDAEEKDSEPIKYNTIKNTLHDYHLIDTSELRKRLIYYLSLQKEFCFDTETTSLETIHAELVGLSFCYRKHEAYYVPIPADREQALAIVREFQPLFENTAIAKVGQNLKYDIQILRNYGIEVKGPLFDTMLAHYLIDPDKRHNMDILAENYLHYSPISIEELIGKKGPKQANMRNVELEKIAAYAAEDADITLQLKQVFQPIIISQKLDRLFNEVEIPLIHVLADMEATGVSIDVKALNEYSVQLANEIAETEKKIYQQAGARFNISSPKQLGEILFKKLKLDPKAKKTKTGQYATNEEILSKLAYEHQIAKDILDYRELQKLKSTYVDALPQLISPADGRVHTSYNQAVAATGRLSSTNPNLQNIPIRTDRGKEIRKAFVKKDEHHLIMSADYSQIELRIMAAFSKEKNMIDAFKNGMDIHSATASKVFGVQSEDVTSEMRRKAKMVNFGIIYGVTPTGLGQRLGITKKEATEIIEAYFAQFPGIKKYMDQAINKARELGYAQTILGRRRYLPDINSANITLRGFAERNAINAPIQGSAADMIKVAMINIHSWMKKEKLKSKMTMQVHDELVFDLHRDELDIMKENIPALMKTAIPIEVPMEVGIGIGENWLEAH